MGASYATGGGAYFARILDFIASSLKTKVYKPDDVMKIVHILRTNRGQKELEKALRKYDQMHHQALYMIAAAIYSTQANAKKHTFIQKAVVERLASDPSSLLTRVFTKYRVFQRAEPHAPLLAGVSTYKTKDVELFIFLTQNLEGAAKLLGERQYGRLSEYAATEFRTPDDVVAVFNFILRDVIYGEIEAALHYPSGIVEPLQIGTVDGKGLKSKALKLHKFITGEYGSYQIKGRYSSTDGREIKFTKKFVITDN